MKLIDRYLLREYLVLLSYCLFGFCMLYVVLGLFEHAPAMMSAGVPFGRALWFCVKRLFVYADSMNICFVVFVMPISILAASLYCLFKLNRQNELIAMRASGMSLLRLVFPYLAVGLLFSFAGTCLQEGVAPGMSRRNQDMLNRIRGKATALPVVRNHKYYDEVQHRRWSIGTYDTAHSETALDVQITVERPDRTRSRVVSADRAEWKHGAWLLYNAGVQNYGENDEPAGPPTQAGKEPVLMTEFTETPQDLLIEANPEEAAKYMSALAWLRYLKQRGLRQADSQAEQRVNTHVRLAMPWVCLVVALISVPAGVKTGGRSAAGSVAAAFLLVLGFYVVLQVSLVLGKKMLVAPVVSAWLPNALFFVVGVIWVSRME